MLIGAEQPPTPPTMRPEGPSQQTVTSTSTSEEWISLPIWRPIDDVYTRGRYPLLPTGLGPEEIGFEVHIRQKMFWPKVEKTTNMLTRGLSFMVGPLFTDFKQFREAVNGYLTRMPAWLFGDDARIRALEARVSEQDGHL